MSAAVQLQGHLFGETAAKVLAGDTFGESGAVFSDDRRYRYRLWRVWGDAADRCLFIMLNPSTADEEEPDPTVTRCINFAKSWGHGALDVCNLFALKSTDPEPLYCTSTPVGDDNDSVILTCASHARRIVCAWGTHGVHLNRGAEVLRALRAAGHVPHALSVTKAGHPGHPLYLKSTAMPMPFGGTP